MSDASLDLLTRLMDMAKAAGADAADALLVDGASLSVGCRLGETERLERAEGGDIGLRVFVGKRQAIVSTAERTDTALREVAERAVAMAKAVPEDQFCGIADPDQLATDLPEIDQFDAGEPSAEALLEMARAAEDEARAQSGITNSEGAEAAWGASTVTVAASNGFAHQYRRSNSSLSVCVLAGDTASGGMERDYDYTGAVYLSDLRDPLDVGRGAAVRAIRRLGARKVGSAQVPVIFEPRVARSLLGHLIGAINGASVARGTTFLAGKLGEAVMAPGVTIVEDPHRVRGLRSRPCDAEGLPTVARNLIDGGVLTTWLLDLRSARQLGLQSTGHASRGISSAPSPSASNVYLQPGPLSPEQMMAEVGTGLLVSDLFGQGVNGITGDYSRGVAGFWFENGEIVHPVSEVTIAGNLKTMFMAMSAGNDLVFRYGMDSPSVRIDGMTLAGS